MAEGEVRNELFIIVESELSKPSVVVCQSCLATDRKLMPLLQLQETLHEIKLNDLADNNGSVCWECDRVLQKFAAFKRQVAYAQHLLRTSNESNSNPKCLSKLSCETKPAFDVEYAYCEPCDPKQTIKEEADGPMSDREVEEPDWLNGPDQMVQPTNVIKIEADTNNDVHSDDPLNEAPKKRPKPAKDKERHAKTQKSQQETKKITKAPEHEIDEENDEDVKEKYEKIEFTQEHMIKSREDKRSGHNYKKLPYKCDSCVLGFTRKETHDEHMKRKHDPTIGENTCTVCAIRFPNEKSASFHEKKHYILYKCKLCKYENPNLRSTRSHCRLKHRGDTLDRIQCQYTNCESVCRSAEEMDNHVKGEHPLHCGECGESFKTNKSLRSHKRRYHTSRREFACDTCGRRYPSQSRLESHVAAHGGERARQLAYCALCRIQYKDIYVLRSHKACSPAHSVNTFQCTVCSKKFSAKVYLKRHMNFFHLKKSKHKCEECQKQFMSSWSLRNHRQLYHGEARDRKYRCEMCDGLFFTLATLKNHKLTHSEERKFMCSHCGDTFKQQASLYTHCKMLHNGKRKKTLTT